MKYKINLKPCPSAPYFTIKEHIRRYSDMDISKNILEDIEIKFRALFRIPGDYYFRLIKVDKREALLENGPSIIVKDDPKSGIDHLALKENVGHQQHVLDLSYSFPQLPPDYSDFRQILIDPNVSLGIPNQFIAVFDIKHVPYIEDYPWQSRDFHLKKDLYLLSNVLDDIANKGFEAILRESNYKAAVLYQMIMNANDLQSAIDKECRSKTMIAAKTSKEWLMHMNQMGYEVSSQNKHGKENITIANYPTHSKELIEMLADRIVAI